MVNKIKIKIASFEYNLACKVQAIKFNFVETKFFCFLLALSLSEIPETVFKIKF